jgi:hypothetical protein
VGRLCQFFFEDSRLPSPLVNTNLISANLTNSKLDGQAQLDQTCGTDAKLPPGFTLKPCPGETVLPASAGH